MRLEGGGHAWDVSGPADLLEALAAYWRPSPLFDAEAPPIGLVLEAGDAPRPASAVFGRVAGDLARAVAARGAAWLHASGVEAGGRAVLLAGPTGAGKSTGAATLQTLGAAPFVDDGAVIAVAGGAVRAAPGPLRPNPFTRGVKRAATGRIARRSVEDSGRILPLGALVLLRAGDGPAEPERLGGRDAFLAVAAMGGVPATAPLAEAVAASVPVYALAARAPGAWAALRRTVAT